MESVPELPASPQLRAFVIWATAGLLAITAGLGAAMAQKNWADARRAALVCTPILLGAGIGHLAPGAHIWSMWAAIALGVWAAHKNSGACSFLVFVGTLGLAAASFMARSMF